METKIDGCLAEAQIAQCNKIFRLGNGGAPATQFAAYDPGEFPGEDFNDFGGLYNDRFRKLATFSCQHSLIYTFIA